MDLTNPTSAELQAAIDDPNVVDINIYGDSTLEKIHYRGCILLRSTTTRKVINNYGILRLAIGNYTNDTHMFHSEVDGCQNITFNGGTFDGNWAAGNNSTEQIHGFNLVNAVNMRFNATTVQNFMGDGFKLAGNGANLKTKNVWINAAIIRNMGRGGITFQSQVEWVAINNCYFYHIEDQAIDFEPSGGVAADRPRYITIDGGGIEHFTNPRALTLSYSDRVTVSNFTIKGGDIQAVSPHNLTLRNVTIYGNPFANQVGAEATIEFAADCRNIVFENVEVYQASPYTAVEMKWNGGTRPNNFTWRGGGVNQPFPKTGLNCIAANNVTIDGVTFNGSATNAIAIASQNLNENIERFRVTNSNFTTWLHALWVSRGEAKQVFFTNNSTFNVTVPYKADVATVVEKLTKNCNLLVND